MDANISPQHVREGLEMMFIPCTAMASIALAVCVHGTRRIVIRWPEAIWRHWHSDDKRFNYYTIPPPPTTTLTTVLRPQHRMTVAVSQRLSDRHAAD